MAAPQTSSRLQLLQARFQQKQLQEKEQKLLQLYDQQQQRAHQVAQRGSAGSNGSNGSNTSNGSSHGNVIGHPAGKVRQMFDERRQNNGKGIDKSYPLEPLDSRSKKHTTAGATRKPVDAVTKPVGLGANSRRNAVGGLVKRTSKPDVNSNVSSGSRTVVLSQRDSFSRESYASSRSTLYKDSVSQRETISRDSYVSSRENYNDLGTAESIRQVNGHETNGRHYEINIDEVIDNEAMERNRMLAKFHPIDIEKRRRFSGDIESEEFSAEMLHDVPDKVAEKPSATPATCTRKSSQAETKAERFKNTNTKKSNATATTATKKRSEPAIPTGANASTRNPDASKKADSRASESIQRKNVTPYPSSKSPDTSEKSRPAAKTSSLKLLNRAGDSNDETQSANENGTWTATRKSSLSAIDYSESGTNLRNQSFDCEKPMTPVAPAPRTTSSLSSSSSIGTNRSQGSTTGRTAIKTKSSTGAPSPAQRSSTLSKGSANNDDSLTTCKICNRRFTTERITLHEQICAKTSQKKRKQFDAVTHRVRGTELESFVHKPTKKQSKAAAKPVEPEVPKSNWRRKHEDFINAIRSAKQMQAHLAAGGKLSDLPPPPPSDTSDYVQCPHCSRKFNQGAAERHIPKCETMQHNKTRVQPRSKR